MSPARGNLEPGRHAHPVDQADALLWAEDVRMRALMLSERYEVLLDPECPATMDIVAGWLNAAYQVLKAVAGG